MKIIKTIALMLFAFGVAITAKYIGFKPWVEAYSWIGLPLTVFGAVAVCFLFDGRN